MDAIPFGNAVRAIVLESKARVMFGINITYSFVAKLAVLRMVALVLFLIHSH